GLKADIASGDRDPARAELQTFNALFPRGAYFAESALIGPANFFDVHPSVELKPRNDVTLTADWDFLWRESARDGLYGPAVNLLRSGPGD
ncbi:MAG: alginate export family protein, partial [Verrucomicrobia bacterium]|nr:alginate export family protein [Verrucomicrobiota bacterium]